MKMDMNKINSGNSLTATITEDSTANIAHWGTRCLVCEDPIPIYSPFDHGYKICDKCKRAILKMREYMKED